MILEGTILRGREFEPVRGRVVVEEGEIAAVEEGEIAAVEGDVSGSRTERSGGGAEGDGVEGTDVILPAFVNAHTHIGDSIAKEAGEGLPLEELVAPPDGLKHRLLRAASQEEKVAAMERTIAFMERSGTGTFVDFREGGLSGVEALEAAAADSPVEPVILGRETIEAMEASDGFGASGANDSTFDRERTATREAGKRFGIHAGEVDESDVNPALDLEPDFLVHMVHAKELHMDRLADRETPVVVCPRSNLATNVGVPPIEALHERTTVALGTDNVFLQSPSMFREMEFTVRLTDMSAKEVLRMATVNGADIAGLDCGLIEEGREARLLVLDGDTDNLSGVENPVRAVVRRAGVADVKRTVFPHD